jgi:hypothetical protein
MTEFSHPTSRPIPRPRPSTWGELRGRRRTQRLLALSPLSRSQAVPDDYYARVPESIAAERVSGEGGGAARTWRLAAG